MKINELKLIDLKPGLRFKSHDDKYYGTIVAIDYLAEFTVYYSLDNDKTISSWFNNDCECNVILMDNKIVYDTSFLSDIHIKQQQIFDKNLINFAKNKREDKKHPLYNLQVDNNILLNIVHKLFLN